MAPLAVPDSLALHTVWSCAPAGELKEGLEQLALAAEGAIQAARAQPGSTQQIRHGAGLIPLAPEGLHSLLKC